MNDIKITGARTHNLKNVNLSIPRGKYTVITGLSGSGKSSLAFDTLYAEGQRRYVESLSTYARQFLDLMPHPDVDSIYGLSPAIAIDQKGLSSNTRSSVGTVTEIEGYLRLLMARAGIPHCPTHHEPLSYDSVAGIVDRVLTLSNDARIMIIAPLVKDEKGNFSRLFSKYLSEGYFRFRIDGQVEVIEEPLSLNDGQAHTIDLVVDRVRVTPTARERLADSIQKTSELSQGRVFISELDSDMNYMFSTRYACPHCNFTISRLDPAMFSPNSPKGCCPECDGSGQSSVFDISKIVRIPAFSVRNGAIYGWDERAPRKFTIIKSVFDYLGADIDCPWERLDPQIQHDILYGSQKISDAMPVFKGVITELENAWNDPECTAMTKRALAGFRKPTLCPTCQGHRLHPQMMSVYLGDGKEKYNIIDLQLFTISELKAKLSNIQFSDTHKIIGDKLLKEIISRLTFLENVGLGYLTLDRRSNTLSGGEGQRIRLAGHIGSGLSGVMYVLDEPSIGLHQSDNQRLINSLLQLRDLGNTLIVVEHDEDAIRQADYVVDMGPRAGEHGGQVMATGTPEQIMKDPNSLTGKYLSGQLSVPVPEKRKPCDQGFLRIIGATGNNLKDVTFNLPVGVMTTVTGISGSGKSSLVIDTLYPYLSAKLHNAQATPLPFKAIENGDAFNKVIMVDQSSIGRTPRSNPATYTHLFEEIREVFANTQMARERGYRTSRFSFNVQGGRCEACKGDGLVRMEMQFLPDVYVPCEHCQGKRYNRETLEVTYNGKNIHEVLEMTVEQALEFFSAYPSITRVLQALTDVGLGYIRLGQSAVSLSGGEAQRVKLAKELARPDTGNTLYILDEPTTGLHFQDISMLMECLRKLVDQGNTVLIIEHNLDVIKSSDYVIDMGPAGGSEGGMILFEGTPEEMIASKKSVTGPFLKQLMKTHKKRASDK